MSTPSPAPLTPLTPGRDLARELAQAELRHPRYHQHDPGPLRRAVSALTDRLDLSPGGGPSRVPAPSGQIAVLLLLVVVGLVVWSVLRTTASVASGGKGTGALFDSEALTSAQHRSAADDFALRGEWALALRERMRALVKGLEERGLLDPRPGRTAAEASEEASAVLPGHIEALREATGRFERVWYGGQDATAEDQDMVRRLDERVRATRASAAPAAGGSTAVSAR